MTWTPSLADTKTLNTRMEPTRYSQRCNLTDDLSDLLSQVNCSSNNVNKLINSFEMREPSNFFH